MNDNATDFIKILQEIRGTSAQGEAYTDGMWWELTIKVIDYMNGAGSYSGGIYTHIKYMYENTKTDLGEFYVSYGDFLIKYADFLVKYEEMIALGEDIEDALEEAENIGAEATSEFWKTMAERMTASSYAVEPVDEFVKIWTSVSDGSFYSEDTDQYSALHWAIKADDISSSDAFYKLDGTTPLTANMPANAKRITDLADGFDAQDAVTVTQLTDGLSTVVLPDSYLKTEHVVTSSDNGGAVSGLPLVLNGNGKIDATLYDMAANYPEGSHDPSTAVDGSAEYPLVNWDTTENIEANWGKFWYVNALEHPEGDVEANGYIFMANASPAGSLFGQTIFIGDIMVFTASGWLIHKSTIDPDVYYRLDGTKSLTANLETGGNRIVDVAPGVNSADAATIGQLNAAASLPVGTILMYSGVFALLDSYPDWFLCDGANNTIDLTDKFIYGTTTESEVRNTGGFYNAVLPEHTHTGPEHSHTGPDHRHTGPDHLHPIGGHKHSIEHNHASFNTVSGGTHTHSYTAPKNETVDYDGGGDTRSLLTTTGSISGGSHAHAIDVPNYTGNSGEASGNTDKAGTGNTGLGGTANTGLGGTGPTGSAGESEITASNLPPYMKLAYIMKVS